MATVFFVNLYEYSPLFYITVISLCLVVTAAIVSHWTGFEVPVILRTSDEESELPTPERHMVQVTNPFCLEIGLGPASVSAGVSLRTYTLQPSVLSCFWGCKVAALQQCLQLHQQARRLSAPQSVLDILTFQCRHCHTYDISSHNVQDCHTQIPAELEVADFGPLPRECYPLVAVLTLKEPQAQQHNINASVTVIHVPDDKYRLPARIVFQYLLTWQGEMFELKPLFMSADGEEAPSGCGATDSCSSGTSREDSPPLGGEDSPPLGGEDSPPLGGEDSPPLGGSGCSCVVCQSAAVDRVLLPCRHTCVCDGCLSYLQHCPVCRAFIVESFSLNHGTVPT